MEREELAYGQEDRDIPARECGLGLISAALGNPEFTGRGCIFTSIAIRSCGGIATAGWSILCGDLAMDSEGQVVGIGVQRIGNA